MSEAFMEKFSEFTFRIVMIILLSFSSLMLLSAYFTTGNIVFFYGYAAALFFTFFIMLSYVKEFKHFRENLNLFIPANSNIETEPLSLDVEDLEDYALKVCLLYVEGDGFQRISEELNIHPEKAKRLLIKGLRFLLSNYKESGKT